jgi:hypothetical protein
MTMKYRILFANKADQGVSVVEIYVTGMHHGPTAKDRRPRPAAAYHPTWQQSPAVLLRR